MGRRQRQRTADATEVPDDIRAAADYFRLRDNWPGEIHFHRQNGKWYIRTMAIAESDDTPDTLSFEGDRLVTLWQENRRRTQDAMDRAARKRRWQLRAAWALSFALVATPTLLAVKGCG